MKKSEVSDNTVSNESWGKLALKALHSKDIYHPETKSGRRWLLVAIIVVAAALIVGVAMSYNSYQKNDDGPLMHYNGDEYVGQKLTTQELPSWAVKTGKLKYLAEGEEPTEDGFYTRESYLRGSNSGSSVEGKDLEVWAVDNDATRFYVRIPGKGVLEPEYMIFKKK